MTDIELIVVMTRPMPNTVGAPEARAVTSWSAKARLGPDMQPDRVKHLEFIQNVVNRLAGNSFSIRGSSVTLVSALFALAAKDANPLYAVIAGLPALCFWGLDAYYLRQERLFRGLYDQVRAPPSAADPANPSTDEFSMDTSRVTRPGWLRTALSRTLLAFHLPIVVAAGVIVVYIVHAKH